MVGSSWNRISKWALWSLMLVGLFVCHHAHATWTAYTSSDAGFNVPLSYANTRTIDFNTVTLATDVSASRISYTDTTSGGSFSQTDTSGATGMSSNHLRLTSPSSTQQQTLVINFLGGGTSYVAFDWYLGLKDQNGSAVKFTFSDGTSQTLYSCNTTSDATCLGAYVPSNFLTSLINLLTLCLFGCNQYDTVYLTYIPASGVKISSITFYNGRCDGCGFLGLNTTQVMYIDNLVYVDPTVAPHHLEVTTPSATAVAGGTITYTVKSCADAACSNTYTTGMSGTLTVSGTGLTVAYPSGQTYSIGARSATTTLTATATPAGTATVALSAPSITPTGSPAVYCGMGVAAASGNSCNLTITQALDHIQVTTSSTSGAPGTAVVYTVTACADATCTNKYTGGLTGTMTIGGVSVTPSASQSFTIASGSYSTTVSFTPTAEGTMTVGVSGLSVTPASGTTLYCGIGAGATSTGSCGFTSTYSLHHVAVTTDSASAVSCAPYTYHLKACATADCSVTYTKGGVSGTLSVTGTGLTVLFSPYLTSSSSTSFSIGTSGLVDVSVWARTSSSVTRTATVALSAVTPAMTDTANGYCGMGTAATAGGSCNESIVSSALSLSVPDHVAESSAGLSLSAVQSNSNSTACTSLFSVATAIPVTFSCTYNNPASGTKSLSIAGVTVSCGGAGTAATLTFNPSGLASTTLTYADVGTVGLSASLVGVASPILGVTLSTVSPATFTTVPSTLVFTPASTTQTAGKTFSGTLVAKTASNNTAPNFGKETPSATDYVRLTWAKTSGTNAGTFSGTGTENTSSALLGSAMPSSALSLSPTVSDLKWSEVGTGTITPRFVATDYLGVNLVSKLGHALTGAASTITFNPDHFQLNVTQGCTPPSGSAFTYSGQPFTATITAYNGEAVPQVTTNYAGSLASAWTLAVSPAVAGLDGTFDGTFDGSVASSLFSNGVASVSKTLSFASKLTVPTIATLTATGSTFTAQNSANSVFLRSGQLKISNAFAASIDSRLDIPVQAQYWSDKKIWVQNSSDSCTTVPYTAIGLTNFKDHKGNALSSGFIPLSSSNISGITITGGSGRLSLTPSPSATGISNFSAGTVDLAINLGTGSGTDSSCLSNPPSSTGAQKAWLRSQNGGNGTCTGVTGASSFLRDPSARITFGIFQPESQRAVFARELY